MFSETDSTTGGPARRKYRQKTYAEGSGTIGRIARATTFAKADSTGEGHTSHDVETAAFAETNSAHEDVARAATFSETDGGTEGDAGHECWQKTQILSAFAEAVSELEGDARCERGQAPNAGVDRKEGHNEVRRQESALAWWHQSRTLRMDLQRGTQRGGPPAGWLQVPVVRRAAGRM